MTAVEIGILMISMLVFIALVWACAMIVTRKTKEEKNEGVYTDLQCTGNGDPDGR